MRLSSSRFAGVVFVRSLAEASGWAWPLPLGRSQAEHPLQVEGHRRPQGFAAHFR